MEYFDMALNLIDKCNNNIMKAKRKNGLMNSLSRFLKFNDTTGYPVSLTYKGSHSYKSVIGGILSLMTKFIVLAYFIYQL